MFATLNIHFNQFFGIFYFQYVAQWKINGFQVNSLEIYENLN